MMREKFIEQLQTLYRQMTVMGGLCQQAIAVAVTAGLHLWKRSTLLSILMGTAVYMLLVQLVFV